MIDDKRIMIVNNYLERNYVNNPNYVLHIYVLFSVKPSCL